jgi:hypothetical protein
MMAKQEWIKCTDWDDLPKGTWLVKVEDVNEPYHVAYVRNSKPGCIVVVGGHFHFDMEDIIAYTTFDRYGDDG